MYVKIAERTNEYDEKLKEISLFEIHPQMIPFVGKNYNLMEKRLLVIAQNPIIDKKEEEHNYKFLINNNIYKILDDYYIKGINDIRKNNNRIGDIIEKWTKLEDCIRKYSRADLRGIPSSQYLFQKIIKASKEINFFKKNMKNIFSYISFMDFFQKPNYIENFIADKNDIEIANIILMEVIKIISPKYIYFASDCAWENYTGKTKNDNIIVGNGSHPGYWNLNQKGKHYFKPEKTEDISGSESFKYFIEYYKIF
jgi:hypothetical protein